MKETGSGSKKFQRWGSGSEHGSIKCKEELEVEALKIWLLSHPSWQQTNFFQQYYNRLIILELEKYSKSKQLREIEQAKYFTSNVKNLYSTRCITQKWIILQLICQNKILSMVTLPLILLLKTYFQRISKIKVFFKLFGNQVFLVN